MRKGAFCLILLLPLVLWAQADQKEDVWHILRFLEGTWTGQGDGMSGVSSVTQTYTFVLGAKFLEMKTLAEFKPQEKNPKGEIHEDMGLFSFDGSRKKFMLRSFYVEGFVNRYVLEEISDDGRTLTFVTEEVENAPPGTIAKLIFKWDGKIELEQGFFVAFPGQEFSCFTTNRMTRSR
jgi:hypothetical protein